MRLAPTPSRSLAAALVAAGLLSLTAPAGAQGLDATRTVAVDPLFSRLPAAGLLWLVLFRLPPSNPAWLGVPVGNS